MKKSMLVLASIVVTISILLGTMFSTYAAELKGDVNSDGSVNSSDALVVLQIAVGIRTIKEDETATFDLNSDGKVNSSDALIILKITVGIKDSSTDEKSLWDKIKQGISDSETMQNVLKNIVTIGGNVNWIIDDNGNVTVDNESGKDTGVLGFKYNTYDKIFITAEDPWQRNFGYSTVYDQTSGFGAISYDTIRVKYNYNGKDWMVQFWKGQYGLAFIGAEVGVYNREEGKDDSTYYSCVTDDEKFTMEMTVYKGTEGQLSSEYDELFTRSKCTTWWLTGFTAGSLQPGTYMIGEEYTKLLRQDVTIYFESAEEASAFVGGLKNCTEIEHNAPVTTHRSIRFKRILSNWYGKIHVDEKYTVSSDGKKVTLSWR